MPTSDASQAARLALLQAFALRLSRARSLDEAAAAVIDAASAAVGAATAGLWLLEGEDAGVAVLVREAGFGDAAAAYARIPLDAELPIAVAMREAAPLWLGTPAAYGARFPASAAALAEIAPARAHVVAALPLLVEGRAIGGLGLSFDDARVFHGAEREFLLLFATHAALALQNNRLYERQQRLVRRLRVLQTLTAELASAPGAREVAQAIATRGAEALGALAGMVWLVEGDELVMVGDAGVPPERRAPWVRLPPTSPAPVWRVVREARSLFVESEADYAAVAPEVLALRRPQGPLVGFAALPLIAEGHAVGAVSFTFPLGHHSDAEDREYADTLAAQCAQALATAQLHDRERAARREAEAASRAKDDFLAMLGHELRNPLAPIVSALALLDPAAGLAGEPRSARRALEVIARQVSHLRRLVDDLLDVARITRGEIELRREIVDVAAPLRAALEVVREPASQREQRLLLELAPGLRVEGDPGRLTQVFTNLLVNATTYTPAGGTIEVRARATERGVEVEVSDDGPGIPPELAPRVFEVFAQGPRERDRAQGGLGLGLAIARDLVERHGGTITLGPRAPHGTVAEVVLPAARASFVEVTGEAAPVPPPGGLRVLLVDDNADAAELLGELLRVHGCEVRIAHDGPSALAVAASFTAQLALLDIGLPAMDGYELARRLRASAPADALAIVALSGYAQPHDVARSEAAGFFAHLGKPLDLPRLRSLLAEVAARVPAPDGGVS